MKINLDSVPNKPGIYIWKDSNDDVIYVGKAKRLRQRMSQYFKGMLNSYKTASLVNEIMSFDYVITSTEKEALVLERNYIEKYFPKYNILLTDDKRYPYIMIRLKDSLEIKIVYRVRTQNNKKAEFFGPYPTGFGARQLANLVERVTMYKDGLPYKPNDINYWREKYREAKNILTSGTRKLIGELTSKMEIASNEMQYEVASDLKKTIESLEFNREKQAVEFLDNESFDVMGVVEKEGYLSISILFYRNGMLLSTKEFIIEITNDKNETFNQFVSQYYSNNIKPELIISNIPSDDFQLKIPKKGKFNRVLKIALENASDRIDFKLNKYIRNEEQTIGAVNKLKDILQMRSLNHILMMDNSNTNNTLPVSVIVSYRNGIKQKKEYRKYNLEKTSRNADVEYMRQGIEKYFSKDTNPIPDLFIVDGGVAQVNEAKKTVHDLRIIGLVKDEKHKTSAIIDTDGKRIKITDAFLKNFLSGMQIEVDRFAKYHHRGRRTQGTLEGILRTIDGVGENTERKLLQHFNSYSSIYNASLEQLMEVVSKRVATNIFKKFNK